jgi:hypothetical protein
MPHRARDQGQAPTKPRAAGAVRCEQAVPGRWCRGDVFLLQFSFDDHT